MQSEQAFLRELWQAINSPIFGHQKAAGMILARQQQLEREEAEMGAALEADLISRV